MSSKICNSLVFILSVMLLQACATFEAQYSDIYLPKEALPQNSKLSYRLFLIGDAGMSEKDTTPIALQSLKKRLVSTSKNNGLIFLGDNIYPKGMPSKKKKQKRKRAEHSLQNQTDIAKDFEGKTIFIPGNHDWYSDGLEGLERQQNFIEKALNSKKVFFPQGGCPLEKIKLTDDIVVIAIDSQWLLEDWNKHPTINDNCPYIKSKRKFYEELKGMLNKNSQKTILIAIHHPVLSKGTHGGAYSAKSHLFPFQDKVPIPGVGSFANLVRKTSGANPQDIQNRYYTEFTKHLRTLTKPYKKVVFLSGHDHNMQYLEQDNTIQIISGSGSKTSATRLGNTTGFSYGHKGYAYIDFFEDGSSHIQYIATDDKEDRLVYEKEIFKALKVKEPFKFPKEKRQSVEAAIYSKEETDKSKFYRFFWGEHYRKYYSTPVEAPIALLDTLFGGLTPVKKGGGNQSNSLRLETKDGKQYVMRALKKSATRFLQSVAFQTQYVIKKFKDTYTEDLLLDFYTSAHPYAPFVIDNLSSPIGVYHTNPVLYYIPKQQALGDFNEDFGNALYMIEERAASGHGDLKSFGYANKVISTDDLFKSLRKDADNHVDEQAYIRARLFDLLIGDWDRHADQWRWAEFKTEKGKMYRPVPRDRDQAFSNYDGLLLTTLTQLISPIRLMQTFDEKIRGLKGFNDEPYPLDLAFIQNNRSATWLKEAQYIQETLTDEMIDEAFKDFPTAVHDETIANIARLLKIRKKELIKTAKAYSDYLSKFVIQLGTDDDDWFEITQGKNHETVIQMFSIKNEKKGKLIRENTYHSDKTKEIWIYGLDDKDYFEIKGSKKGNAKVRLIGGQNKDTYVVKDKPNVKIHDFKSKKNSFDAKKNHLDLIDRYEDNTYNYRKIKKNTYALVPELGANPDDGFRFGFSAGLTHYGYKRDPYSSKHSLQAMYYNATKGYAFRYTGDFITNKVNWNFNIDTKFTSPNYSINYFGEGNETVNEQDNRGKDYNRVKLSYRSFTPAFVWNGHSGATFSIGTPLEGIEIGDEPDRITSDNDYERENYAGARGVFKFENYDNLSLPTLGFAYELQSGWRTNLDSSDENSYIRSSMSFVHKLNTSGSITLSTKLKGHHVFQDSYEIYQAASIGGDDGLRGYRNQRFTGQGSFYQNTDIRLTLKERNTALVPISYGITLGYDYGRVWVPNESSKRWHDSYGGSIWMNATKMITGNMALFYSDDGPRFSFGLGFGF